MATSDDGGDSVLTGGVIVVSARPVSVTLDTAETLTPTPYTITNGACSNVCLVYLGYSSALSFDSVRSKTSWFLDFHSYQTWGYTTSVDSAAAQTVCQPRVGNQAFLDAQVGFASALEAVNTLSIISSQAFDIASAQGLTRCGSTPGTIVVRKDLLGAQISSVNSLEGLPTVSPTQSDSATPIPTGVQGVSSTLATGAASATVGPVIAATVTVISNSDSSDRVNGLGTGAKAGIGVGVAVAVLLVLGALLFALRHRRKQMAARKAGDEEGEQATEVHHDVIFTSGKPELQGQSRSEMNGSPNVSEMPTLERYELDGGRALQELDGLQDRKGLPAGRVAEEIGDPKWI